MSAITFVRVASAVAVLRGAPVQTRKGPRTPTMNDRFTSIDLLWEAGMLEGLGPGEREFAAVGLAHLPLEELRSRYEAAQALGLGHHVEGLGL